jgi:hypothetical protein
MSKKQFVIDMLEKLIPHRTLAADLRKFVMLDILDNNAVNGIIQLLKEMAIAMKNKTMQAHMIAVASTLEKMKNLELQEKIADQQEAENILATL